MTPEQRTHLERIVAHIDKLLATAAQRTPGEWKPANGAVWANTKDESQSEVCDFIAQCAGNAEAGWRATRAAVPVLLELESFDAGEQECLASDAGKALESILAAWPIELLDA